MEWFKKHIDTISILGTLLSTFVWMNGRFNEVESRFNQLDHRLTVIKTVLVLKNIMPSHLASKE